MASPRRRDDRLLIEVLPLLRLVERGGGIDERECAGERGLDLAARRHEGATGEDLLALADHEIVEQRRGVGMRRVAREPLRRQAGDRRRQHEPVDRRAFAFSLLGEEAVDSERERNLAACDQAGEHAVALAHRDAVLRHDVAKQPQPGGLAELGHDLRKPVVILGFDTEPPVPSRIEEIAIALGQLFLAHEAGVVGLHESREIDRRPLPMRRDGLGHDVGEIGRLHLLQ